MRLTSIASGSSGNCIYVGSDTTHLLVDVGISAKRIENSLNEIELKGVDIDGILITHEHIDHISGLGVMARRYQVPIYTTGMTAEAIMRIKSLGKIDEELFHVIEPDHEFIINDLTIEASSTWHDAVDSVCYTIKQGNTKAGIATDLGNYDDYIIDKLKDSNILFIEANHDVKMLEVGPYPYHLKQRILGNKGHLSNERAGQLICNLLSDRLQCVFLGHLSNDNNFEELAFETVKLELSGSGLSYNINDIQLQVANRDTISRLATVKE